MVIVQPFKMFFLVVCFDLRIIRTRKKKVAEKDEDIRLRGKKAIKKTAAEAIRYQVSWCSYLIIYMAKSK